MLSVHPLKEVVDPPNVKELLIFYIFIINNSIQIFYKLRYKNYFKLILDLFFLIY